MSNSPSKGTARFSLDRSTPSLWRVTLDNPPINLIDPVMIVALHFLESVHNVLLHEEPRRRLARRRNLDALSS
jgi:hypothetical protein